MQSTNDKMVRLLLPATIGVCIATLALTGVSAIASMSQEAPHVGDIVSFTAGADPATEEATRLIVHRPDQYGCALDLGVLRRTGGSVIVEGQVNGVSGAFRVHWAGPRTTTDAGNCGDTADLIMQQRDLDILALSAGGYGIDHKRMPVFVTESGG